MPKTSQKKAKDVIRSPLKWAGGKSRLLDKIFRIIPDGFEYNRFIDHAVRHPQRRTPSIIFEENLVGGSAGLCGGHLTTQAPARQSSMGTPSIGRLEETLGWRGPMFSQEAESLEPMQINPKAYG